MRFSQTSLTRFVVRLDGSNVKAQLAARSLNGFELKLTQIFPRFGF